MSSCFATGPYNHPCRHFPLPRAYPHMRMAYSLFSLIFTKSATNTTVLHKLLRGRSMFATSGLIFGPHIRSGLSIIPFLSRKHTNFRRNPTRNSMEYDFHSVPCPPALSNLSRQPTALNTHIQMFHVHSGNINLTRIDLNR